MRKILFAVLCLLCAASMAHAQATTQIVATHVQGLNGTLLVSGSLCFQATDQNDINIGIQVSGGGTVIATPFCTSVANGAITPFSVPNPQTATPTNTRYRIYVTQGARVVVRFPLSYLCNQAGACGTPWQFNFDTCLSSGACIANPIPITTGPAGPAGPQGPTGPAGSGTSSFTLANAASTGTTVNKLVKVTGAPSTAVLTATTDKGGIQGICTSACGTTGSATIQTQGGASCVFDGATTAGDYVQNSGSVAGDCTDAGVTYPTAGQVLGVVLSTNGSGGTYNITLFSAETHPLIGLDNTWTSNDRFKGMIPWADLSAFTRALPSYGCSPAPTATISLGSPTQVTLSNGSCFLNGDGITIPGAGAANGLATPTLSTITPASISTGGTALGGGTGTPTNTVAGAAGSSTYSYVLIGRTKKGGYTPASTPVSTTTGLSSLGSSSCAMSTYSRSGLTMTLNFSSACEAAVVGAGIEIVPGTGGEGFWGFYTIKTAPSSSQVTIIGSHNSAAFGWNSADLQGSPNSGTGGTVYFITSNHLQWSYNAGTWYYYVCAERPGDTNFHLIGRTYPSTAVYKDLQFDDYGSPFNDSQRYPPYIETGADTPNSNDAICTNGSGLPDPLTTTVVSGGGTTSITLANAATTAVSSGLTFIDNGPGLVAAANSVIGSAGPGQVYITPGANSSAPYFLINSYTQLPQNLVVHGAGNIITNETIEEQASITWDGGWGGAAGQQFSYFSNGGEQIIRGTAFPAFYVSGPSGVHNSNLTFISPGNYNGQLDYVIDGSNIQLDNNQFDLSTGVNDNYFATAILFRGTGSSNPSFLDINHAMFVASTMTAVLPTLTPYIYTPPAQLSSGACASLQGGAVSLQHVAFYQRGMIQGTCNGGGENWYLKDVVRQAGFMPLLWILSGSGRAISDVVLDNVTIDTGEGQFVATGNQAGNPGLITLDVTSRFLQGTGQFTGITDYFDQYNNATGLMPNSAGKQNACFAGSSMGSAQSLIMNCDYNFEALLGPNAKIFSPLSPPTSVTPTAVSGGSIPASVQLQFELVANDPTGNASAGSLASTSATTSGTCPGSGNCRISVAYTGSLGAASYSLFACQVGAATFIPQCPNYANMTGAVNFSSNPVIFDSSSVGGGSGAFQPPLTTLAGLSGLNSTYAWATYLRSNPQVFANLPSCTGVTAGLEATVTDSNTTTWGANIAGSSTNTVLAFCDGSNWTVYGK